MDSLDYIQKKEEVEAEIKQLKLLLKQKEAVLKELINNQNKHTLTNRDIQKYSRQIIVPSIGVKGQQKLREGSVLIIGCGGLGCPAAQYLTGCGIGRIGLVDYDVVEENNLHRQILHSEDTVGISKVDSVSKALQRLNSDVQIDKYKSQFMSSNALEIIGNYDVVIDASDNVATRYLVNDACVLTGRPLISGSAVKMEGQLTVYNYQNGPCYRCLFPNPPPKEAVSNCGDVGVLGPVPGVIGVLQALQAIHIITNNSCELSGKLLIFDGMDSTFRNIKLREKVKLCSVCGQNPTIKELIDYEQFCGTPANDKNPGLKLLKPEQRISPKDLLSAMKSNMPHVIIDVRSCSEFDICSIPGSKNIPLETLTKEENRNLFQQLIDCDRIKCSKTPVYIVCRRGNDSQLGVLKLLNEFSDLELYDLKGGLHAWANEIDPAFPVY